MGKFIESLLIGVVVCAVWGLIIYGPEIFDNNSNDSVFNFIYGQ